MGHAKRRCWNCSGAFDNPGAFAAGRLYHDNRLVSDALSEICPIRSMYMSERQTHGKLDSGVKRRTGAL